jgi:hypothetical protein
MLTDVSPQEKNSPAVKNNKLKCRQQKFSRWPGLK